MVGLLPEEPGLYSDMTGPELLEYFARLYRVPPDERADRIEEVLTTFGLWDPPGERIAGYSKGMRQRLALARALVHEPSIMFLDEPTANLDPEGAAAVRD